MNRSTVARSTVAPRSRDLSSAQVAVLQTLKPISYNALAHPNEMLWQDLASGAMNISTVQADFGLLTGLGANAVRIRVATTTGAIQLGSGLQPTTTQLAVFTAVLAAARDAGLMVYLLLFDGYTNFLVGDTQTYLASLNAALPVNHTVVAVELKNEVSSAMIGASAFASWLPQIIPSTRASFPGAALTVSVFGSPDGSTTDGADALRWLIGTSLGGQSALLDFYSVHDYMNGMLERQSVYYQQALALVGGAVPLNIGEAGFSTSFSDTTASPITLPDNLSSREAFQEYNLRQMFYLARQMQSSGKSCGDPLIWQLYDYPGIPDMSVPFPAATPQSGGSLTASTVQRYAVVWTNSLGETCPTSYIGQWVGNGLSPAGVKTSQGFASTSPAARQVYGSPPQGSSVLIDTGTAMEAVTITSAVKVGNNTTDGFTTTKSHTLPVPVALVPFVALGAGQGSFVIPAVPVPFGATGMKVYVNDADNSATMRLYTGTGATQGPFSADGTQVTAPVTVSGYGTGSLAQAANTSGLGSYVNNAPKEYGYGLYRHGDEPNPGALKPAGVTLQGLWKNGGTLSTYWNQDFEMPTVPDFAGVAQYPPLWRGNLASSTSGFSSVLAGGGLQHGGSQCVKIAGAWNTTGSTKFPFLGNVPFYGLTDPTKTYTLTGYLNVAALLAGVTVRLNIGWIGLKGNSLPNSTVIVSAPNGGWTQYSISAKPPSGAVGLLVFVSLAVPASTAQGADTTTLIYVDDLAFSLT